MSKFESQASLEEMAVDPKSAPMGFGNLEIDEGQDLHINDNIDNMVAALKINNTSQDGAANAVELQTAQN